MPLQATSGAASYDAFGGGVPVVPKYIEDYFSTFLYTGTGASQTITNGIDLSAKGGLVWIKDRSNAESHSIWDTARGVSAGLQSNATSAQYSDAISLTAYNSNGFSLGADSNVGWVNRSPDKYVSWSIAKAPKFFDVVTFSGNDVDGRAIPHNLGSVPGFVMIKCTSSTGNWMCWHNSFAATDYISLNTDGAKNYAGSLTTVFQGVSSTTVTVGTSGAVNSAPQTYVMYLFAHNAGGFGLTGTDNVISCGSYTGNGSTNGPTVTLGYEPQWLLVKNASSALSWYIVDNMRGFPNGASLFPNDSTAESNALSGSIQINATGFTLTQDYAAINANGSNYIYIAIRRGPMKVPTSGTSVFSPIAASSGTQTTGFPVDMQILSYRSGTDSFLNHQVIDRLRGVSSTSTAQGNYLNTSSIAAESNVDPYTSINMSNTGFDVGNNYAGSSSVFHSFRRAPSVFDAVCYSGTGSTLTIDHNLQVTPELIIIKRRNGASSTGWVVYSSTLGFSSYRFLNDLSSDTIQYLTATSSTTFTLNSGGYTDTNSSGNTYVAYLFATCAGVSKVFSYTGNGSSQTINCGFTGGARFVLIKRTNVDSGDWFVWDSARGIVSGNDPHLSLNSTAAEVTSDDSIDTNSTGFVVNQVSATNVNVSSATYIGLAIA